MILQFDNNDTGFLQWMQEHPQGFVVNTERSDGSHLAVLHCARCHHITSMKSLEPGAYTEREYIKICSDDGSTLKSWLITNRPNAQIRYCRTCEPTELPFLSEYPDEVVDGSSSLWEGAKKTISVNSYERNPVAHQQCIQHYGARCRVCKFDFGTIYGGIGSDFIHVHHLIPLSNIDSRYQIDPIRDLQPVCPNCHAMLHRKPKQPYTIEELKEIMRHQRENNR